MIKPLSNYIVLTPKKTQTASGIILNENFKDSLYGIVYSVNKEESDLKVDDVVVFKNTSATELNHQNQKYLIVLKEEIMAVINYE